MDSSFGYTLEKNIVIDFLLVHLFIVGHAIFPLRKKKGFFYINFCVVVCD